MSSIHEEWLAILVLLTGVLLSALTTLIGVCLRLLAGRLVLATLLLALAALLAICPAWFGSGEGFEGTESPLRTSGSGLYWESASKEGRANSPTTSPADHQFHVERSTAKSVPDGSSYRPTPNRKF